MKLNPGSRFMAAICFVALFLPATVFADTPIGAKAVFVEGAPTVLSVADSTTNAIVVGSEFREGDRVKTGSDGIVEIEFDTSNLIRIDKNSDMVIKALHRNDQGSTQSIFHLFVGRVKSAVSKLVDKKSKFEYQTKAAIAGVAGTPPFFFAVLKEVVEVDLTGKEGGSGEVYVRGKDTGKTLVRLFPGFRTTVTPGIAPINPFRISAGRLNQFRRNMPFRMLKRGGSRGGSGGKGDAQNASGRGDKGSIGGVNNQGSTPALGRGAGVGGQGMGIVVNTINQNVSTPRQNRPDQTQGPAGIVNDNPQDQGLIGNNADSSGDQAPPPTTSVNVIINLE